MADFYALRPFTSKKNAVFVHKKDPRLLPAHSEKAGRWMLSSKSTSHKPNAVTRMALKGKPYKDVSAEAEGNVLSYASARKTKQDLGKALRNVRKSLDTKAEMLSKKYSTKSKAR